MALIQEIRVVQGDTRPNLEFTVLVDGVAQDLTDTTVRFKIRKFGETININDAANTCTITEATNGICEYPWRDDDLEDAGDYEGELEITFGDDTVQTQFPKYLIKVRPQL